MIAIYRKMSLARNRKTRSTTYRRESARLLAVPKPDFASHYPLKTVQDEVVAVIREVTPAITEQQMAGAMGISSSEFSRKKKATHAKRFFNFEQLGCLFAILAANGVFVNPGWPFVSREQWTRIKKTGVAPQSR